jgi:predicted Fe-Mo cluster-binding NifX family protein
LRPFFAEPTPEEKTKMRIAVTSQNFRAITGHAGKTRRFLVFEGQEGNAQAAEVERLDLPKEMSLHEYHGDDHPIFGFDVVVTGGAGTGFVRRLAAHGVRVVVTSETDPGTAVEAVLMGRELPPAAPHDEGGHGHDHGGPPVVVL